MRDETATMVTETVSRLFGDQVTPGLLQQASRGVFPDDLWAAVQELGIPGALLPEDRGGYGIDKGDAFRLVKLCGRFALPLPLPETMVARQLLAEAGLQVPVGPLAFAASPLQARRRGERWAVEGVVERVPWGRSVTAMAVLFAAEGSTHVGRIDAAGWEIEQGVNIADEPRDRVAVSASLELTHAAPAPVWASPENLRLIGAGLRALAMSGAMEAIMEMTLGHARERNQFGRPLAGFQAIQHGLARIAGETAAAAAAADMAADSLAGSLDPLAIAAAKARCGEAAGIVAAQAHQIHGAMGFSREHPLHFHSRRLWAWRDEFGCEDEWSRLLGARLREGGGDGLWPALAAV